MRPCRWRCGLLIEPYGIEIGKGQTDQPAVGHLLIEPYGIEIRQKANKHLAKYQLLIEPYGIEIGD